MKIKQDGSIGTWVGVLMIAALAAFTARGQEGEMGGATEKRSPQELQALADQAAEYERDFKKAAELQRAAVAALSTDKTASHPSVAAAQSRLELFEARVQDAKVDAAGAQDAAAVGLQVEQWAQAVLATGVLTEDLRTQISMIGAPAVPHLERLFREPRSVVQSGGLSVRVLNLHSVAAALVSIGGPEAEAAVLRALESDIVAIREAATRALVLPKHRSHVDAALRSDLPRIRDAAISALYKAPATDVAAREEMTVAMREGGRGASEWLSRNDRPTWLSIALDPKLSAAARESLRLADAGAASLEEIERMLEAATSAKQDALDAFVLRSLCAAARSASFATVDAALRLQIEGWLIETCRRRTVEWDSDLEALWSEVGSYRSAAQLEAFANLPGASRRLQNAGVVSQRILSRMTPDDFRPMLDGVRNLAPEGFTTSRGGSGGYVPFASHWIQAVSQRLPVAAVAAGLEKLADPYRRWYLERVIHYRLNSQESSSTFSGFRWSEVGIEAFVPAAVEMLRTDDAKMVKYGLEFLAQFSDARALEEAARIYADAPTGAAAALARSVVQAAAKRSVEAARAVIEPIVSTPPSDPTKVDPVGLLGALPEPHMLEIFERLWKAPRGEARTIGLLYTLINPREGTASLKRLAELYGEIPESAPHVREAAIRRFSSMLYEPSLSLLRAALSDPSGNVRSAAKQSFEAFKESREAIKELDEWTRGSAAEKDAAEQLQKLLDSPSAEVVLGAVKALGAMKAKTALPKLVGMLAKADQGLTAAIHDAIARMGG